MKGGARKRKEQGAISTPKGSKIYKNGVAVSSKEKGKRMKATDGTGKSRDIVVDSVSPIKYY